jgi:uncharacterized FlaG/YvyC family protein
MAIYMDIKSLTQQSMATTTATTTIKPTSERGGRSAELISSRKDKSESTSQTDLSTSDAYSLTAQLKKAMEEIQEKYEIQVELDHDEETGRQVVRILSSDGERVLREIPPEEAIRMASRAWDDFRSRVLTSTV